MARRSRRSTSRPDDWSADDWWAETWHGDGRQVAPDPGHRTDDRWQAETRHGDDRWQAETWHGDGRQQATPDSGYWQDDGWWAGTQPESHEDRAAADPDGGWEDRAGPKRGRLIAGFALGAATVLAVQFGSTVVTSPPVAVVAGTALPAAGAAAPAAGTATSAPPPPTSGAAAAPAAQTPSQAPPPALAPQKPGTVRLPAGGTATLVRQNLGPGGELPIPADLGQATWWGAALDAAGGASVFAGHVNWKGATGPFAELWNAGIGGLVTIVDSAGKTWRYRISQLLTVHKNDLPARADELFGQSGPHRVVLVTCGGRWVGGSAGYEENRVVIADPA